NDAELAVVDGDDGTVAAEMFAASTRFRVADRSTRSIGQLQRRIAGERRKPRAIGDEKMDARDRACAAGPAGSARPACTARPGGQFLLEFTAEGGVDADRLQPVFVERRAEAVRTNAG